MSVRTGWQLNPYNPTQVQQAQGFRVPYGLCRLAAAASSDGRRGSSVYEVNSWLWNPRLGGLTVKPEETAVRKETVRKDQANRSAETQARTSRRRRADRA